MITSILRLFLLSIIFCVITANDQHRRQLRKVFASEVQSIPTESYGNPTPGEGPWPECVGQTGEWCMDYIAGWVGYNANQSSDNRNMHVVSVIKPYEYVENRVWVYVDDNGDVITAPRRG